MREQFIKTTIGGVGNPGNINFTVDLETTLQLLRISKNRCISGGGGPGCTCGGLLNSLIFKSSLDNKIFTNITSYPTLTRYVNVSSQMYNCAMTIELSFYEAIYSDSMFTTVSKVDDYNFNVSGWIKNQYGQGFNNDLVLHIYDSNNILAASYPFQSDSDGNFNYNQSIAALSDGKFTAIIRTDTLYSDYIDFEILNGKIITIGKVEYKFDPKLLIIGAIVSIGLFLVLSRKEDKREKRGRKRG